MKQTVLTPGADIFTPHGRGAVIEIRATPSGNFVIGSRMSTGK
ncbi:hypothetical protein [Arthrobacter sp. TMN-50]